MQFEMFPKPPKTKPVLRAHVSDAGEGQGDHPYGGQFTCKRCAWESDWLCFDTLTEMRRGIACPQCNRTSERTNMHTIYYGATASGKTLLAKRHAHRDKVLHIGDLETEADVKRFSESPHSVAELHANSLPEAKERLGELLYPEEMLSQATLIQACRSLW